MGLSLVDTWKSNQTFGEFAIDAVLPYVSDTDKEYKVGEQTYKVNMFSLRYQTFINSLSCVRCEIVGNIFILERQYGATGRAHFNLYHKTPKDKYILITKDHILPASCGGKDDLSNMQTMCALCNHAKDDLDEDTAKTMFHACKKYNDDIEKAIAYIMLCSDVGIDHKKVRKHMVRFFASETQRALAFN